MVGGGGAVSIVGSSLHVDSRTSPCCLRVDAVAPCNLSAGDLILRRHSSKQVHVPPRLGSLELNSSFLDYSSVRALSVSGANNLRKHRKRRSLVVVDQLPPGRSHSGEANFDDVKQQILDYFTYKAVRTVLNQLYEMNPPAYRWFYNYVASNQHGFGKSFIRNLVKENHELAERVMVTRLDLYGRWIKKCDHTEMYERISNQNLELMRERLMETVIWLSDHTNMEEVG